MNPCAHATCNAAMPRALRWSRPSAVPRAETTEATKVSKNWYESTPLFDAPAPRWAARCKTDDPVATASASHVRQRNVSSEARPNSSCASPHSPLLMRTASLGQWLPEGARGGAEAAAA